MTRNPHLLGTALLAAASLVALAAGARAADTGTERPLVPLAGKLPPAPPAAAYGAVVRDKGTLVALGKALFWDTAVGSRGDLACASCHFHAGADPRTTNALDPGLNVQPAADATFGDAVGHRTGSGAAAGPNYALKPGDFPFHRLADPANRNSAVLYDTDDVTSSAGAFNGTFASASAGAAADGCANPPDGIFHTGAGDTRRVEPRNTPSAINAVFMRRNFWDGRASNTFNGVDPFGAASIAGDPTARVLVAQGDTPVLQAFQLPNMSAASQAVGPPLSGNEMSCAGRRFADIGRRLLTRPALAGQRVAANDSVLAGLRGPAGLGLASTYADLVQKAFQPAYWQAAGLWAIGPNGTLAAAPDGTSGRSQAELNFSLFFGLAIDAYERTLVSNQSPFDKGTLSADERAGLEVFKGKGKCSHCHDGPLLSKAATFRGDPLLGATTLAMAMGAGGTATYDLGFYDIGVRPAFEDLGVGGADRFGNPLSFSRQRAGGSRIAVDGAFKTPSLRNVALTPPYFHDGGEKSLADVVAFYSRGGNVRGAAGGDTTGTGPLGRPDQAAPVGPAMGGSNLDPEIENLGLSAREQAQLVAFLKALTDPRVACHRAPFDHPSLLVPVGAKAADADHDGNADDQLRLLPAAGAGGLAACNLGQLNSGDLFANKAAASLLSTNLSP